MVVSFSQMVMIGPTHGGQFSFAIKASSPPASDNTGKTPNVPWLSIKPAT